MHVPCLLQGAALQFDRMFRKLLGRGESNAAALKPPAPELQHADSSADAEPEVSEADVAVVGNEHIWLELISALTQALVRHLPSFWQLPQVGAAPCHHALSLVAMLLYAVSSYC